LGLALIQLWALIEDRTVRARNHFDKISPWKTFLRTAMVCSLLGALLCGLAYRRIEPIPLNHDKLVFSSENSFGLMRHLAKNFPGRVTWSESRVQAGQWIKGELARLGYSPKSLFFSEVIAGKQYTNLENIYVEKKGTTHPNEIIAVIAHYDITDTTREGAMDDASGVGVVMELARVFAQVPTERTLLFLLTDSEEFGAFWGATAFVHNYEHADQIVAGINFDFIAPEKQTGILTLCDGLKTGYTPLWLREIALDSLRSLGSVKVHDMYGFMEFVERAMQIPPADHGPLLANGIPAFNWVGQTENFPYVMAHYHHTPYDVVEAMHPESFQHFGAGAERVIRTIDSLPKIPENFRDSSYLKLSPHYYLPGWAVTLLHILAFIPFLTYSLTKFGKTFSAHSSKTLRKILQKEAKVMGILLGSLLLGYVVILLLPALDIITQYEIFPATQKSLLLYSPNFTAMFLVVASVLFVHWLFKKTFAEPHDADGYPEIRHALHAAFLAFIILLAFLKNSYLATLLLLPPAYFWMTLNARRHTKDRILNGLLLFGGSVTFVAVAVVISTIFHVGSFYWYLFLSAAYGLVSAYSVILFFMALTVMIRLFKSFVL